MVVFGASWGALGRLRSFRNLIFAGLKMFWHAPALAWRGCSDPYKTLAGMVRNTHQSKMAISRATPKTSKNRPSSPFNVEFGKEHAKLRSWNVPTPILEGFGHLPAASWVALGRSWMPFEQSWAGLELFLGVSWALLGGFWLPHAAQETPTLDFGGFRERPGRVSEIPNTAFFDVFSNIPL